MSETYDFERAWLAKFANCLNEVAGEEVREQKAGKVEYRVDKAGIVHVAIGKKSFEPDKLLENAAALIDVVIKAKPAAAKGTYLKKIAITTTMGPGVRIDPAQVDAAA